MVHLIWAALVASSGLVAGEHLGRLNTSLTILVNNDLHGASSPNADTSVIVTESRLSRDSYERVCSSLGEQPYSDKQGNGKSSKAFLPLLEYLKYEGKATAASQFWVAGSSQKVVNAAGVITQHKSKKGPRDEPLQGFCTNKAPFSNESSQDRSSKWQISVDVNNQTLTGFRDRQSFRFLGVRYAAQPKRFTYSTLFQGSGEAASALEYGSQCAQGSDTGSEDCLFLNVWTPYLPNPSSKPERKSLRPVAFWIHGGAFTGGTANDATFDGGSMVSRGDVVVVAINYRLSTLGFLALKDGVTNGNYGLADQITALDWVRKNIQSLGGDPDRITIFGQSAGAGSVRALIASPKAAKKFSGAILLSNLGGLNYGTTYSKYYTIDEQVAVAANTILNATNCTSARSQVDCLRALPAQTLTKLGGARYLVVDGTYLTSPSLPVDGPPLGINLMIGITHDDGAPFITYPTNPNISQTEYLASQGFSSTSSPPIPLDLFPLPASNNRSLALFTSSSRLATDAIFRCVDQATTYSLLKNSRVKQIFHYEFDRTYQTTGWPKLDVCEPPKSKAFPLGDPSKDYLKCHSGELYYVFGTLARQGLPDRDGGDIDFSGFVLDSFLSFFRTGDPNIERDWLSARGYEASLEQARRAGVWEADRKGKQGRLREFNWPKSKMGGFRELEQCKGLGLGVESYYG